MQLNCPPLYFRKLFKCKLQEKCYMHSISKYMNRIGMQRSTNWYKDWHGTWLRKQENRRRGCSLPRPRDKTLFPWRRRRRQRRRRRDFFCDLVLAAHFKCLKAINSVARWQNKPKPNIHMQQLMLNSFQSLFLCNIYSKHYYYVKYMRTDTITETGGKKV